MGRTQTFDTATVVRAARTLFWEQGYEGVAVPELEAATGVGRSSLYHAFGSKRGLFDAAVESYLDEVVRPRLRPLTFETVSPAALVEYLSGLRAALLDGRSAAAHSGCLLLNTATAPVGRDAAVAEVVGRDAAVAEVVASYRAELHAAFHAGVLARDPAASPEEVARLATLCTAAVVTAFVLARVDAGAAGRTLDAVLGLLRPA